MNVQRETESRPPASRLDEVETLLEQTAALAEMAIAPDVFSPRLLEAASRASAAKGAALWRVEAGRTANEIATTGSSSGDAAIRASLARLAGERRRILSVPPGGRVEPDGLTNATSAWLLFAPAPPGHVLELSLSSEVAGDRRLLTEVARSFAELAGDYFERQELMSLRHRAARWRRLESFVAAIHRPLELSPTVYAVVNDGRLAVGCDRLSLAIGRRARITAVSGVERPDRRAEAVSHLERIADAAVRSGETKWLLVDESSEGLPKRLAAAHSEYRSSVGKGATEVAVLHDPSGDRRRVIGVLIAEWFGDSVRPEEGLEPIVVHAESALAKSLRLTPGPLGRLVRAIASPLQLRCLPATTFVLLALLGICSLLTFWQTDFTVDARGRLRPEEQRDVFASRDGIVRTLHARHGQSVRSGDVLLVLADPTLDFELERVLGDLKTTRQRLVSIQAARTTAPSTDRGPERPGNRGGQLAGEEKELSERLTGLERQLAVLEREREGLNVVSPIDGVVLTWGTEERLESRPVRRGQRLLTVAQPEGDWLLELFVSDRQIGHVLGATAEADGSLPIEFLLATDPARTYRSSVDTIASSTELHESGEPSVKVTARLTSTTVLNPRAGATVVAKIHCGRRPVGYVWLHELIEAIQTHVLF